MGRSVIFNGLELIFPDAYSALDVSRLLTPSSGGVGIVALVGESDGGKPGLHIFQGGSSPAVVKKELVSGPGANCMRLLLRSGSDSLVQAGASTGLFYKTNNSTASSLPIPAVGTKLTLTTKQYGAATALFTGNIATSGGGKLLTVFDENGIPEVSPVVGALPYFSIHYTGDSSTATVEFHYISSVLTLKTVLAGDQTDGSLAISIPVTDSMTVDQLVALINNAAGGQYVAVSLNGKGSAKAATLDLIVTPVDVKTAAVNNYASMQELIDWGSSQSQTVTVTRAAGDAGDAVPGTFATAQFSGGTRGTTSNTDVQNAYNALLQLRVNITVPLFSSDSQDGSSVVVASVNSIVKDHVESRSSILGRSECQSYVSIAGNKDAFKAECARLSSRWMSVTSQKITDLDIDGNSIVYPEYGLAVVCAQTQAGSPIGTPLTYRQLPIQGLTQDVSWNPIENANELIKAGALIAGPDENNINRVIAGYTCWLGDDNNANIYIETVESLAIFAFNHRKFMKQRFLGKSAFTQQDVMDAILESEKAERDDTKAIKGFDKSETKIFEASAGKLVYDLAVIPWEGIVFILPTVVAIRETA